MTVAVEATVVRVIICADARPTLTNGINGINGINGYIYILHAAGFVLNLLYGICGSIGMILAGLGGFAAFLALLDGSYAQAAASALVALLLCPFAAPMLLSLAGSALIVAASALFAWLF